MTIEWLRDLVIVIWGLGGTVAVIIIVVLAVMIYAKVRPIVNSAQKVAATVETITTEVAGPLAQVVAFVQGFRKAMGLVQRKKK